MATLTNDLKSPDVRSAKRLVIKIGSALLVDRKTGLKQSWLSALALDVAERTVWATLLELLEGALTERVELGYSSTIERAKRQATTAHATLTR